jgi:hypothetical protein
MAAGAYPRTLTITPTNGWPLTPAG